MWSQFSGRVSNFLEIQPEVDPLNIYIYIYIYILTSNNRGFVDGCSWLTHVPDAVHPSWQDWHARVRDLAVKLLQEIVAKVGRGAETTKEDFVVEE